VKYYLGDEIVWRFRACNVCREIRNTEFNQQEGRK
jgi:hypothetical protein